MLSAEHFRHLLDSERTAIAGTCADWQRVLDDSEMKAQVPEEAWGKIQIAVGQAQLLMRKKFEQFRGLIDDCKQGNGERTVTVEDLQGFWELMYIQVEDIHHKFAEVKGMEQNGWEVISPVDRQPLGTLNKNASKVAPARKSLVKKDFSAAAKQRLAEAKAMARKRLEETQPLENGVC